MTLLQDTDHEVLTWPESSDHGGQALQIDAVDLFSGAGGLACGFSDAGIKVRLASDVWRPAADTYRANFPDHQFLHSDIRDIDTGSLLRSLNGDRTRLIVGGPPCQGFSSAGARSVQDPRNTLVGYYSALAAEFRPEMFVFENVEGFLTAGGGRYVRDLLDPLIEAGYTIRLEKVNVANYGVPQLRKRVIVTAALGRVPAPLNPTHAAFGAPGAWRVGQTLPPTMTVSQVLSAVKVSAGDPLSEPRWPTGVESHRIRALKPGQTMRDLPEDLQHESWTARANRRVRDGTPTEKRGGAPIGLRRLVGSEPSRAITSAATREFVHPTADRTLTLREAATIQTFPPSFQFVGTRSEIATLIGNAVPPVFASALAKSVQATFSFAADDSIPAGLAEFQVTHATAMSPALKTVSEMVKRRYPAAAVRPVTLF